jgi:hypothetical protein
MNARQASYAERLLIGIMIGAGGAMACVSLAISLHLVPQFIT